jgi:hypothetical protein
VAVQKAEEARIAQAKQDKINRENAKFAAMQKAKKEAEALAEVARKKQEEEADL